MLLWHKRPESVGGDICIKFDLRSRKLEFLERQCGILEKLLKLGVSDLVSGYSGIVDETGSSNCRDTGQCVSRGIIKAFDMSDVSGKLRDVLDVA